MHHVWRKLGDVSKLLFALHESGHAVVAYHLRVPFSEIAVGEHVEGTEGIGHIILKAVPSPVSATYLQNRITVLFSGGAALKQAICTHFDDPDVAEFYK